LTWEDTQKPLGTTGLARWQRISEVIEPNNFPHMPPTGNPQLTDSDLTTMRGWLAACAHPVEEGSGCDTVDAGAPEAPVGDAATE
jgi:hypothetical protein